jgi:CRP-like cAMP-binding protein
MISPELLRKYKFFSFLADDQFGKVAMLADEADWEAGQKVFGISKDADFLYLLETGEVELHYAVVDELISEKSKEFFIGSINPGEAFGLSAVIEPYEYTANAIASTDSTGIQVDAKKLRALAAEDTQLGFAFMAQVAKASFERLSSVRVELAAARN